MILQPGVFHFSIQRTIGQGGLGIVREILVTASACEHPTGARLALKELNERWRHEPAGVARFEREIVAIKNMSHPRIIAHAGENLPGGSSRFYVMQLYKKSLRDVLQERRGAGFPWPVVAGFGAVIADAMSYAHGRGFIHRDLKPENILIDDQRLPVIADWGLGYFVHKASKVLMPLTRAGLGTEYYCSMEQWNSGKCGPSGDVYSLGLVLAELINGAAVPIRGVGLGVEHDLINDGSPGGSHFNSLLRQMTEMLPSRRLQTMHEVAAHLRWLASVQTASAA
ncbi:MAG TPA: serine/threonine-protein kinase [Polyangia bacterium]|nr:serine/threonine-protein kinase [Polyangia bacterium]